MMKDTVYIVSYYDVAVGEPTVTAFSDKAEAKKCFEYFKDFHNIVALDEAPVHHTFYSI